MAGLGLWLFPEKPVFHHTVFNPYLIISLLAAGYFGLGGTLGMIFAVLMTYFPVLYFSIDFKDVETILTHEYLAVPALIVFLCPIISEFNQRLRDKLQASANRANELALLLAQREGTFKRNQREVDEIRKLLITKTDTLRSISRHFLNFIVTFDGKDDLLKGLSDIMRENLNVSMGGIYLKEGAKELKLIYPIGDHAPKEVLNLDDPELEIARRAMEKGEMVKLDYVLKRESERKNGEDEHFPYLIAGPFRDAKGEVTGVVLVERMDFLSYIPSTFSSLEVYLQWFSKGQIVCQELEGYRKNMSRDPVSGLLLGDFFIPLVRRMAGAFADPMSRIIISVSFRDKDQVDKDKRRRIFRLLAATALKNIMASILTGVSGGWDHIYLFPFDRNEEEAIKLASLINDDLKKLDLKDREDQALLKVSVKEFVPQKESF